MSSALAAVVALVVGWAAAPRPAARRARGRAAGLAPSAAAPSAEGAARRRPDGVPAALGARLLAVAARAAGGTLPAGAPGPRRAGAGALAVGVALLAAPPLALVAVGATLVPPLLRTRREAARSARRVAEGLPDVVDLLAVAVGAGWAPVRAVAAVAGRAPAPWDAALAEVVRRTGLGVAAADALDALVEALGEPARPLSAALRSAELDGAPLAAGLDRLAADARSVRRRRAEETARRVPVRLLFPLVLLGLPAFALLSLAPLIAGALQDLPL